LTKPFREIIPRVRRLPVFRLGRAGTVSLLAAAVFAASATVATALPAGASATASASAARFAAAATPFQNKVLEGAMSRVPGGTRISAGEVKWDGGRIALEAFAPHAETAASPDQGFICYSGYFCAWSSTNYDGSCAFDLEGDSGYQFNWAVYSGVNCGGAGTWSWQNLTGYRAWKEQYSTGGTDVQSYYFINGSPSGLSYCISPGSSNPDVTNATIRTLGWIYTSGNSSAC
jgi:hypothetical protein